MIRATLKIGGLLSLLLSCLPNLANAQCVFPFTDLVYGLWQGNDGGLYHIRQIGGDVWWVGMSSDNGQTFTNVFHGQIKGRTLSGGWLDVPHGMEKRTNAGDVRLEINDIHKPTILTKLLPSPTGPAVSKLTRVFDCPDNPATPR